MERPEDGEKVHWSIQIPFQMPMQISVLQRTNVINLSKQTPKKPRRGAVGLPEDRINPMHLKDPVHSSFGGTFGMDVDFFWSEPPPSVEELVTAWMRQTCFWSLAHGVFVPSLAPAGRPGRDRPDERTEDRARDALPSFSEWEVFFRSAEF